MSKIDQERSKEVLNLYYDFLLKGNHRVKDIYAFAELHMEKYRSVFENPELNVCLRYLIIHFKKEAKKEANPHTFKKLYPERESALELIENELNLMSGFLLYINQLNINITDTTKRSLYFDSLLTKNDKLNNFICSNSEQEIADFKQYFINKDKKNLSFILSSCLKLYESVCIESLELEDLNDVQPPDANMIENDFVNKHALLVKSYTDPYFFIKYLCHSELSENDFYSGITNLDTSCLNSFDYDRLLYKSFLYKETRSLKYLISLYNDLDKVSGTYIKIFSSSSKEILKYDFLSKFTFSLTIYNDSIQNNPIFLKSLCIDFLKNLELKSNEDIIQQIKLFELINTNPFSFKNKDGSFILHHILLESNNTYTLSILNYFFKKTPLDDTWKLINDDIGNNFMHLCVYQTNFRDLAIYLIEHSCLIELFFSPNTRGKRPIDFILESNNQFDIDFMLGILNIIVLPNNAFFPDLSAINNLYTTNSDNIGHFRENLKDLLIHPYVQEIIKSLDNCFPIIHDFIMYDVYTQEKVDAFEIYVKETLDDESNVFSWVKKLKEVSGRKKLLFNKKLKENLSGLRATFPNFKEFIDHVENYIYLNDMGDGYFWIPPSLLVSSPGIGKTFFLHSLSKIIGVTYDMISMESVTAGFVLVGSSQQWRGGQPGEVFSNVFKSEFANSIIILDEIDKAPQSNYPVDSVLLPLLESHTAQRFKDEFVNIPLDISKMVWLATANDIDRISAPIKSRFQIFKIPSPTFEERMILTQAIYNSLLKDNKWGEKFETTIEHAVCFELSRDRNSSRDLRKTILDACGRAAKRNDNKLIINDLNIIDNNKEIELWDKQHD